MTTSDDDVLTSEEAARLLKVARATLLHDCRAGLVPCQRVGRSWRFRRSTLLAWLNGDTDTRQEKERSPAPQPADPPAPKRTRRPKQGQLV